MRVLPILFNTDMVRALLEEQKTVTRRVIKSQPPIDFRYPQADDSDSCWWWTDKDGDDDMMRWWPSYENGLISPYKPGDILYVRETWGDYATYTNPDGADYFMYRADYPDGATTTTYPDGTVFDLPTWRPSIHMPKEAARIFLRVKAVWVERLQEITEEQARAEGVGDPYDYQPPEWYEAHKDLAHSAAIAAYAGLWNRLYAKPMPVRENGKVVRYESYPWENIKETKIYRGKPWFVIGNPWLWVIEFERVDKTEGWTSSTRRREGRMGLARQEGNTPDLPEYFLTQIAFMHPELPDLDELKELVQQMLRMMCQKTGGEMKAHTGKCDIPFEGNYERVRMCLLNGGIRLARSGILDNIDLTGPMPPPIILDKAKMKDRDRNEANIRETFWGREVDADTLKRLVDELEGRENEETKRLIILETVMIVLSGRLDNIRKLYPDLPASAPIPGKGKK